MKENENTHALKLCLPVPKWLISLHFPAYSSHFPALTFGKSISLRIPNYFDQGGSTSPHSAVILRSAPGLTYLCNLVEQFVVFLSFLQGAQIAAHPSCQGNGAECPPECVRLSAACASSPQGDPHSGSSSSSPSLFLLIRVSSEIPPSLFLSHTHLCYPNLRVFLLCIPNESLINSVKCTWLPFASCLSLPLPALTCMPPYTLLSATSSLSVSVLSSMHTLLAHRDTPPPVASCLHMPAPTFSSWIDSILIGCLRKGGWLAEGGQQGSVKGSEPVSTCEDSVIDHWFEKAPVRHLRIPLFPKARTSS